MLKMRLFNWDALQSGLTSNPARSSEVTGTQHLFKAPLWTPYKKNKMYLGVKDYIAVSASQKKESCTK